MSSVEAILQPEETIVLKGKSSVLAVALPAALLILGALVFVTGLGTSQTQLQIPALLLVLVGGWGAVTSGTRYVTTDVALTDSRILGKFGLVRPTTVDSPLNKIDRVQVEKPFIGRILGYGTVVVTVSGAGRGRERFPQISQPEQFAQRVRDQASAYHRMPH